MKKPSGSSRGNGKPEAIHGSDVRSWARRSNSTTAGEHDGEGNGKNGRRSGERWFGSWRPVSDEIGEEW